MSRRTRRDLTRLGVVGLVIASFVAVPLLAAGPPAIKEDLYVSDTANKRVIVLNAVWRRAKAAETKIKKIIGGFKKPTEVAVGAGNAVVVDGKFVRFIGTSGNKLRGKVKTGKNTRDVAITPDGSIAVATVGKKNVVVIDVAAKKVVKKIVSKRSPFGVEIDGSGRFAVITNVGNSAITIVDLPVVLASDKAVINATGPIFVDGVRQLKKGVCRLGGGVDVGKFFFGTFAIWSCGSSPLRVQEGSPGRAATGEAQEVDVLGGGAPFPASLDFPNNNLKDISYDANGNPQSETPGGVVTVYGPFPSSPRRFANAPPDNYGTVALFSFNTFGVTVLAQNARLITAYAAISGTDFGGRGTGNKLLLFHPNGVEEGKVATIIGNDSIVVGGVGSTLGAKRFGAR